MRKVKTVCTVGPASAALEILKKLVLAGMDVARLNFSHGTYRSHAETISRLRQSPNRTTAPWRFSKTSKVHAFGWGGSTAAKRI